MHDARAMLVHRLSISVESPSNIRIEVAANTFDGLKVTERISLVKEVGQVLVAQRTVCSHSAQATDYPLRWSAR